ncbi:hypothetical protein GOBAR_AA03699 [Gossypium barbadense]|uniref:Uncharacterized protein n=1 Tax=Gossypium barbadense TaxID=3634 RepID=A0A2P5YMV4_GOSBA|nr:hypothetical protein GOBAR_AA03699 [Gossypium barbadense]
MDFAVGVNSSGLTSGIGRATKKVSTRLKVQLDFDDPTVDNNGQMIQSEIPKAAYKLTILGDSSEKNNGGFLEEEFTLLDGGAVTKVIKGVPSITFSNRVQEFIQQQIANTIPDCLPMVTRVFNKSEWY